MSNRSHSDDVVGHLGQLRRYARVLTRDETKAEDLVHDALVRAYERRATFRLGGNLRSWLFAILHNTFVDARRRHTAEIRREAELSYLSGSTLPPPQESSVRLDQIRRAFDALPDDQRAVLHLVAIEGMSYQDAANSLSIPLGTLMSRLGRARAALRTFEEADPAGRPQLDPPRSRPNLRVVGGHHD